MNEDNLNIKCELISDDEFIGSSEFDFDKIIFDLNSQIDLLSNQTDCLDYIVAIASGIVCGILDILWVGEFDLAHGRSIASDKVDSFVKNTAEMSEGKTFDDVKSAVQALEKHFPIPSDGNTSDFGGGKQHHLRDFAHHPTIVGLAFSLLTQFTEKSYGTDVNGRFITVDVPEKSKPFIGKDIPEKILMGTIICFFHLVSDIAGSSSTAGTTGGTGIPGPLLALAKEVSAIPFFKNIKVDDDMSMSLFLSKLFNGTLMMKRDEKGQIVKDSIIKFDLRGELGVAVELCKQAVPVVANECFVRAFYFIRHLAMEMKENRVGCFADMKMIDWDTVKPLNNSTIARMLTISTGVFTVLDIGEASIDELQERIAANDPQKPWYRLILLEAMLFEPYYPLGTEKDKKGNDIPSKKYKHLNNPLCSFRKGEGDRFLDEQFTGKYCKQGYVKRLRKSYDKRMRELSEVLKTVLTSLTITAVIAIITVASAGAFAGPIAVALVGSNFAGLSGAALTSACLAYLGGGAIAAGGAGMLGGTIAIVGGGAALGIGVGAGVGGAVGSAGLVGKKNTIMQSAKLLTSVREIFLNDEHDIEFSNSVYEQYLQNITEIEKGLVELRLKMDVAKGKEKKEIAETIKKAEESVEAMKVARKNMLRFNSSFAEGLQTQQ